MTSQNRTPSTFVRSNVQCNLRLVIAAVDISTFSLAATIVYIPLTRQPVSRQLRLESSFLYVCIAQCAMCLEYETSADCSTAIFRQIKAWHLLYQMSAIQLCAQICDSQILSILLVAIAADFLQVRFGSKVMCCARQKRLLPGVS